MAKKEVPHLRLRLEPRLLQRLEKSREKSGRTLTGEIAERLEQSFAKDDTREFIKEAALDASTVASTNTAAQILSADPERLEQLFKNIAKAAKGES